MKRTYKKSNSLKQVSIHKSAFVVMLTITCYFSSCKKYLDIKPDKSLQLPSTLVDCQALMADYNTMNGNFPYQGEVSSDNFFLAFENWKSLELNDRDNYIWKADANVNPGMWSVAYLRILNANQVLATLNKIIPAKEDQTTWNRLKGAALFFRAYSFYQLAQIWSKPYDAATAAQDLGIPVRLTPDLSEKTTRGTVQQTYDQIINDLKEATDLLPAISPVTIISKTTQLTKAAAWAALARTYLAMRDYTNAGASADACLKQYNTLLNYNAPEDNPNTQFNKEVIFDAQSGVAMPLYYAKIDADLYASYQVNDVRKTLFFRDNGDGSYAFKGNYTGTPSYLIFSGLATDEVYLIRAECYARAGNTANAMADLNTLMQKRWVGTFVPFTAADPDEALALILRERRKELLFRGLRWTDLRRLNKESHFAVTLKRSLDNQEYVLPSDDLRYVLLIPTEVLSRVDIPQNPR
jgi:tetratricopeptide (TPR) repeat protein